MRRAIPAVLLLALLSCSRKPDSSWGWERHDGKTQFKVTICGDADSKTPYVGIFWRYKPGGEDTPRFTWSMTTGFDASDVKIDGRPVAYEGTFILFVNDAKGQARRVTVPQDRLKDFRQDSTFNWTPDALEKFWKEVVQPQLGS